MKKLWYVLLGVLLVSCSEKKVTSVPIDVIAVTPLTGTIRVGESIQFTGVVMDVDLNPVEGIDLEWSSSDSEAISINSAGLATGLAMARNIVITASANGLESNNAILHVAGDPARITLDKTSEAVVVGHSIHLSGRIKDALGTPVPSAEISSWQTADESLLSVSKNGTVIGLAKGFTTIQALYGTIKSALVRVYIMDIEFTEDFSGVDTNTVSEGYFRGHNGIIWQINHELESDTSAAGPLTGKPAIINESGNNVLQLTEPSNAYFTNRQLLIMTYGSTTYDTSYMWPTGDGMLTKPNFRVQMRIKGMDDPVGGTSAESLVFFTQYYSGAASPYYLVYAPGRNRVSAWFGATLAPEASIPDWGSIPEIDYNQWFNIVVEVFDGTMRTEIFTGAEPTGEWDYSYTIPDWTGTEESIPGFWFGAFLVDEYYADDIIYYAP